MFFPTWQPLLKQSFLTLAIWIPLCSFFDSRTVTSEHSWVTRFGYLFIAIFLLRYVCLQSFKQNCFHAWTPILALKIAQCLVSELPKEAQIWPFGSIAGYFLLTNLVTLKLAMKKMIQFHVFWDLRAIFWLVQHNKWKLSHTTALSLVTGFYWYSLLVFYQYT